MYTLRRLLDQPIASGRLWIASLLAHKRKGQAVVEFAFIVIIMTVMLAGTLELGRAFSAWLQVGNIARAGAQYGSMAAMLDDGNLADVEIEALKDQDEIYGVPPEVDWEVINDEYDYCAVRVTVDYAFEPLMPIGPIPSEINLTRSIQMRLQFVSAEMENPPLNGEGEQCR